MVESRPLFVTIVAVIVIIAVGIGFSAASGSFYGANLSATITSCSAPCTTTITLSKTGPWSTQTTADLITIGVVGGPPPYTANQVGSLKVTYTYQNSGSYTVHGKVSDSQNHVDNEYITIQVSGICNCPNQGFPSASFTVNPTSGPQSTMFSFTPTVTGGTSPYSYSWNFHDGSPTNLQQYPQHYFTGTGSFAVVLTVNDANGNTGTAQTTVTVTNSQTSTSSSTSTVITSASSGAPISVTVSANPQNGQSPLAVQFSGSVTGGTAPYTFGWIFGDQSTSSSQNPSHVYMSSGSYLATLTVTDSNSQSGSGSTIVQVAASGTTTVTSSVTSTITTPVTTSSTTVTSSTVFTSTNSVGSTVSSTSYFTTVQSTTNFATSISTGLTIYVSTNCPWSNLWPSSLRCGFSNENVSIGASSIGAPLLLSSTLTVNSVQSSGVISFAAWNSSIFQIDLGSEQTTTDTIAVTQSPAALYSDGALINTWSYSTGSGILTIDASAQYLTLVFPSSGPVSNMSLGSTQLVLITLVLVVLAVGTAAVLFRKRSEG